MWTGLLCAVAGRAGLVVPPAYGTGEFVEGVVFVAFLFFFVGPVEAEPVVFVDGSVSLRLMRGEGAGRRCQG